MTRAQNSMLVFGSYLLLLGIGLLAYPHALLALFAFALVDAAGAGWTAWSLRRDGADAPA